MIRNRYFFAAFFAIIAFMAPSTMDAATKLHVDVNGDGEVNIADINAVVDYILYGHGGPIVDEDQNYLSAKDYGAVGDGETDDTEALEALFNDAFNMKKAVFFDPGTYIIRRSLLLRTGMEIYGEDATLKKRDAVTTTLDEPTVKDQTYIEVKSAEGFNVGDQFFIADPAGANQCTYCIVTAVEGNRISFYNIISDHQSNFPGCIKNYDSGLKVSTSFALLRSWSTRYECDGVFIHDLTLDGNRNSSEAREWSNSCIHIDSYYPGGYTGNTGIDYRQVQRDLQVRNVVIKNSPCDAISDQGEGGLIVRDCVIQNSAMHGVHVGTKYNAAVIANNTMTGNGSVGSGVFFCQEVYNVIVDNNKITSFNHGCSDEEFGTAARYVTIRNNEFQSIKSYVFDFLKARSNFHCTGLQISNNRINNLKAPLFSGDYLDNVILSDNVISSVTTTPSSLIKMEDSKNIIIYGNKLPAGVEIAEPIAATDTENLIENSNSWN
ncbi:MAG: right-handed parallel beta-helix repeat-containing protein [Muribaculaceae bacterium]|nr:right-handed parallel beta-helix repeat-containing protein [Muribaculaceae bacterium]